MAEWSFKDIDGDELTIMWHDSNREGVFLIVAEGGFRSGVHLRKGDIAPLMNVLRGAAHHLGEDLPLNGTDAEVKLRCRVQELRYALEKESLELTTAKCVGDELARRVEKLESQLAAYRGHIEFYRRHAARAVQRRDALVAVQSIVNGELKDGLDT